MNIWVEYWPSKSKENKNYFAQSQLIKWSPPNKEDVRRRFCQDREQAQKLAINF